MTLVLLGAASMAFVAVFTIATWRAGHSPRAALLEAWSNVFIGFAVNYVANLLILPLVGLHIDPVSNFWMGWLYTSISVLRSYAIRRWCETRIHALAQRLGGAR